MATATPKGLDFDSTSQNLKFSSIQDGVCEVASGPVLKGREDKAGLC